jgi:competence protein ComGC
MKKVLILTLLIPLALLLLDCGGKPKADIKDIPDWYLNPPKAKDKIYGTGDGAKHTMALAKETADSRARDDIARQIAVQVSTMLEGFMQESGLGEDAEALEFVENVSKHVTDVELIGCKISKRVVKEERELYHVYSLAECELENLVQETLEEARRQKSLYNEAKAKIGFEELEKEIQKLREIDK